MGGQAQIRQDLFVNRKSRGTLRQRRVQHRQGLLFHRHQPPGPSQVRDVQLCLLAMHAGPEDASHLPPDFDWRIQAKEGVMTCVLFSTCTALHPSYPQDWSNFCWQHALRRPACMHLGLRCISVCARCRTEAHKGAATPKRRLVNRLVCAPGAQACAAGYCTRVNLLSMSSSHRNGSYSGSSLLPQPILRMPKRGTCTPPNTRLWGLLPGAAQQNVEASSLPLPTHRCCA
jgi:hypothetical protein